MKKITLIFLLTFSFLISFKGFSQISTWSILTSGTTTYLTGVSAVSPMICYVCGNSGVIMKTVDGGATWNAQSSSTSANLSSICFTDANNGVAVGDNGTVVRTVNGGSTWSPVSFTSVALRCVYFYNSSTGYATGGSGSGSVFKTIDGGASWNPQSNSASNVIYGIKFTSATDGYFCDYDGEVFKTTDGGNVWSPLISGTTTILSSIDFSGTNEGVVIGRLGTIRKTTTSGTAWSGIASGTTDALSDIKFVNASTGFIMGFNLTTNIGIILKTTDGGDTWAITYPGTPSLIRASFVSPNCGYAVGMTGTILKYYSNVGIAENGNTVNCDLYPNPTTGKFEITVNDNSNKKTNITVFNPLGELIYSDETEKNTIQIDLSNQSKGIYFAVIKTDKGIVTKKIVLEN